MPSRWVMNNEPSVEQIIFTNYMVNDYAQQMGYEKTTFVEQIIFTQLYGKRLNPTDG